MKKLIIAAGLITALALAAFGTTGGLPVSFAGSWTLDKAKSQGLDQRMQNAESVTCVMTQDDKTISVEWKSPTAGGWRWRHGSRAERSPSFQPGRQGSYLGRSHVQHKCSESNLVRRD